MVNSTEWKPIQSPRSTGSALNAETAAEEGEWAAEVAPSDQETITRSVFESTELRQRW